MKDKKQTKKKIYVSALAFAMLGSLVANVVKITTVSAWGPERTTYTNESPADHAVFNSITNNAAVGDERDFVRIAEVATDGGRNAYVNEVHVTGGKDYEISVYYHNNASTTLNDAAHNYIGVARKTRLAVQFASTIEAGATGQIDGKITSTTTDPESVWDEAFMIADEKVKITYISGSARIYNDWSLSGTQLKSEELFSAEGIYLGVRELNGLIPGCDEFSGSVRFRVHAETVTDPSSTFEMDKKVSTDGGATWQDDTELKPGAEAEFKITYRNTGNVNQKITAFDTLENGEELEYVAGSTRIVANGTEMIVQDADGGKLFKGGVEVGEIKPGETAEIYYKVKVAAAENFSCGKTTLYNLAGISSTTGTGTGENGESGGSGVATLHDKVRIEVTREDNTCLPSTLPSTGPAELVLAGVVVAGLIVGIVYYINSKKTLKKLEEEAKSEGF